MDTFTSLSTKMKVLIVASTLFLVTLSTGILVFGDNIVSHENTLIQEVKSSAKADLLYVDPGFSKH